MGATLSYAFFDKTEDGIPPVSSSSSVGTATNSVEDGNKNDRYEEKGEKSANTYWMQRWEINYKHLKQYKQTHGHCSLNPSYKTKEGIALGKWVENQRSSYKRNNLLNDRFVRLNKLGVSFERMRRSTRSSPALDRRWKKVRRQLKSYNNNLSCKLTILRYSN